MRKQPQILINFLLTSVSILISFSFAELSLRILGFRFPSFYTVDRHLGYKHRAGAEGIWKREGHGHVSINDDSFRGKDYALKPSSDTFRIAMLGDSFVESFQVDDKQTSARLLESYLSNNQNCKRDYLLNKRRVEVLNFGVGGYSTLQSLINWRHNVKRFKPSLTVLMIYPGNDFTDSEPLIRADRPVARLASDKSIYIDESFRQSPGYLFRSSIIGTILDGLINKSYVLQSINELKNSISRISAYVSSNNETILDSKIPPASPPEASDVAWEITVKLLESLRDEVDASGSRLLLVTASSPDQVWPKYKDKPTNLFEQERRLSIHLTQLGIDHILLGKPLMQLVATSGTFLHGFPPDTLGHGHWNADGNKYAARLIAKKICHI